MSNRRIIFILGVWVAILPFLGFPASWKQVLFVLSGLTLIGFSYYIEESKHRPKKEASDVFTDNGHEIAQKHESTKILQKEGSQEKSEESA